ncbi:MAG: hypothetical protein NVSMB65_11510 [Chloroflexota bacterium]
MIEPQGADAKPGTPAPLVRLTRRREGASVWAARTRTTAAWAMLGGMVMVAVAALPGTSMPAALALCAACLLLIGAISARAWWVGRRQPLVDDAALRAGDLATFISRGGRGRIAFRLVEGVALVEGEPASGPDNVRATVTDFLGWAQRKGWTVAFSGVCPSHLLLYQGMGFQACRRGRAAVVDLAGAPFGRPRSGASQHARALALGAGIRVDAFPHGLPDEGLRHAVLDLCAARGGRAMYGVPAALPGGDDAIVVARDHEGVLQGVALWRREGLGGTVLTLRVVERAPGTPAALCTYLLTRGLEILAAAGYRQAILGWESGEEVHAQAWIDLASGLPATGLLFPLALRELAAACGARWQEHYLLYTQTSVLPTVLYAVQRAALPHSLILLPGAKHAGAPASRPALYRAPRAD